MSIRQIFEYLAYAFVPSPEYRRGVDVEVAKAMLSRATHRREYYEHQEKLYQARISRLQAEGSSTPPSPFPPINAQS